MLLTPAYGDQNALSTVSKSWKRAPTSRGDVAVSPYFKVEFGKLYNIPHLKNATFSHKYLVLLVILLHLSHFFVSISVKSMAGFQKVSEDLSPRGGWHYKKIVHMNAGTKVTQFVKTFSISTHMSQQDIP